MSLETVKDYLKQFGLDDQVLVEEHSTATVALAAEALGVTEAQIAKTMAFQGKEPDKAIIVVVAGDKKISNSGFKQQFGLKAHMLQADELLRLTGHVPGGVCPFALDPKKTDVYLDVSLKPYDTVYPACGTPESCIKLTIKQLEEISRSEGWVDVCKHAEDN